jgi:hypothetical protein
VDSPGIEAINFIEVANHYHVVPSVAREGEGSEVAREELLFLAGPILAIEHFHDGEYSGLKQLALNGPSELISKPWLLSASGGKICRHDERNYPGPDRTLWGKALIHIRLEVGSHVSTSIAPLSNVAT